MLGNKQGALKECRAMRRVSLVTEVICHGRNAFGFGKSENVSETGMMVKSPETLPLHSEIRVRFILPVHPQAIVVETKGRVVWVRQGMSMGIEFLDLKGEYREAIVVFVQKTTACEDWDRQ